MTNPFKIKKEERGLLAVSLIIFVLLNAMTICSNWDAYTEGATGGFWSIFTRRFSMSGYDCWSWITVSGMRIHFATARHPLYLTFLYPMYLLNHWLILQTGFNWAVFFIGIVIVLSAVYSAIFLYRILREIIGLSRRQSLLLDALFFSFGHVMLPSMVPDHFIISTMLLLLTAYIAGTKMQKGRPMAAWQTMTLLFFTAGMATSNGVKTLIAAWFANRSRLFRPRYLLIAVVAPVIALVAINRWQYYALEVPQQQVIANIEKKAALHPNAKMTKKQEEHRRWVEKHDMKRAGDGLLSLMDFSSPRLPAIIENFVGEPILIHSDHALGDVYHDRPVIVHYHSVWGYVLVAAVMLFLILGLLTSARERLLQMLLLWLSCDVMLHLVLGFGINECYIMASGWLFIIPISMGYLMRRLQGGCRLAAEATVLLLALLLWGHNGWMVLHHLM